MESLIDKINLRRPTSSGYYSDADLGPYFQIKNAPDWSQLQGTLHEAVGEQQKLPGLNKTENVLKMSADGKAWAAGLSHHR